MRPPPKELESITIRRAKIADPDKVRYRVYTSPTEYVAVIAPSALMAVRVSGVAVPYKILRDIATHQSAVEADRMEEREEHPEKVAFALHSDALKDEFTTEMSDQLKAEVVFVPVKISELESKGKRAQILSPELMQQIIEEHSKQQHEVHAEPEPVAVAPVIEEPVIEPEISVPAPVSTEDKITQMASELLPSDANKPAMPTPAEPNLSPEEVNKLLNE